MPFRAEEKQKQKKGKREYNAHWENLYQKWGKNNKFLVTKLWQKATFLGKSRRKRLKKENVAWGIIYHQSLVIGNILIFPIFGNKIPMCNGTT